MIKLTNEYLNNILILGEYKNGRMIQSDYNEVMRKEYDMNITFYLERIKCELTKVYKIFIEQRNKLLLKYEVTTNPTLEKNELFNKEMEVLINSSFEIPIEKIDIELKRLPKMSPNHLSFLKPIMNIKE